VISLRDECILYREMAWPREDFLDCERKSCLTFSTTFEVRERSFVSAMISRLVGIGRFQVLSLWLIVGGGVAFGGWFVVLFLIVWHA